MRIFDFPPREKLSLYDLNLNHINRKIKVIIINLKFIICAIVKQIVLKSAMNALHYHISSNKLKS